MYQRGGGAQHTARIKYGAQLEMVTATEGGTGAMQLNVGGSTAGGKGGTLTKKLILWLILLLQICFIGCLWLLQLGGGLNENMIDPKGIVGEVRFTTDYKNNIVYAGERVNFIKKAAASRMQQSEEKSVKLKGHLDIKETMNNFRKDFSLKPNGLNNTGELGAGRGEIEDVADLEMLNEFQETETQVWCFREGTLNDSGNHGRETESDDLLLLDYEQCNCLPNWHGKDCGQPEVIWRALMTSKTPFKLLNPFKDQTHQLVLMLEGNFFNMDLLELQVKTINDVVDYFIIYLRNTKAKLKEIKELERKLKELLNRGNYLIFHCNNLQAKNFKENCTSAHAYKYFRNKLKESKTMQLKPTDLFVYMHDHELLSRHALKFLKYYAADIQTIRFRLKYTVYGFYWQHPERTQLSGLISSFVHLDNPQSGNADPVQLLRSIDIPTAGGRGGNALVIGDLNHFGGWFCKYCQQPDDIIAELHAELSSLRHVQFPNVTRSRHIDAPYLQKLIANGIYIDGKTQLLKLRHYTDKYYAPVYAEQNSWKFGNLLVNLFESFDEDIDDDVGLY